MGGFLIPSFRGTKIMKCPPCRGWDPTTASNITPGCECEAGVSYWKIWIT